MTTRKQFQTLVGMFAKAAPKEWDAFFSEGKLVMAVNPVTWEPAQEDHVWLDTEKTDRRQQSTLIGFIQHDLMSLEFKTMTVAERGVATAYAHDHSKNSDNASYSHTEAGKSASTSALVAWLHVAVGIYQRLG